MDELKAKTITSLFWKGLERVGNQAIALIVQIVMARLLAPEQFGNLAILVVFVNFGNIIVQYGLNIALVQANTMSDEDCSTVFWMNLFAASLICFLIALFADQISAFFGCASLSNPLRFLSLVLIINAYNGVQCSIIQRELQFKKFFMPTILSVIASGILGIALALEGFGLWALVFQQICYQAVNCLALSSQVSWRPRMAFNRARARGFLSYGWKLLFSGLLDVGYRSLSDLIIGKKFSTATLGYVSQGEKYPTTLGTMLDSAIQPVMMSAVSRVQDDITLVKRLVRRALKTSSFLVFPAMCLFALESEPLVILLLGDKWLPSVPFMQMYCFIFALLPVQTANLQALNGMGRSDVFFKLEVIKKSYGIMLLLLAAFVFGNAYAMVGMVMISAVLSTFVNASPNKIIIGYSYREQLADLAPIALITLLSASATFPLNLIIDNKLLLIVTQGFSMVGIYLLLAKVFHLEVFDYLMQTIRNTK
ncbi:lipopolysaccharide biosynthesis protein [Paraeggerthella sp. Marseille-Q4926]|uniref:lipopolysaccharide biosynthesis protein n=1 Tax=Paraeggerthella sp. Marseille-Q4926 TaxID=2866587 RepID=UPI001CE3B83E|nr:lipopolysaccharide biosynthesis protein [Paraeggerthella sp. Marseille-Q4926]